MDFAMHYTEEQEKFRQEVLAWIKKNVPEKMKSPIDQDDRTPEYFAFWRERHKELGAKGWLHPTFPKQYGGGGLSPEHESILQEEFVKHRVPGQFTNGLIHAAMLVWGTEEQKQKFLKPMLTGHISAWQKYSEPQSGTDLANCETTAVRDGDEWILNGANQFVTGVQRPHMLYGPAKTDPDAPRHRNLGFFLIPFPHPGVEIADQKMVNNGAQHFIYLRDARVPADHLLGGETQGWQVVNTVLEAEHGGRGQAFPREDAIDAMVTWLQEHKKAGRALGDDPVVLQEAVEAYCEAHALELMNKRTYAFHMGGIEMTWEGSNTGLFTRDSVLRNVGRIRHVYGPYALLGAHDSSVPHGGVQDARQRSDF
ncbi:MAG: acyl-CoA dehydrogenase family protein, partial [Chloroflexota bacterium]